MSCRDCISTVSKFYLIRRSSFLFAIYLQIFRTSSARTVCSEHGEAGGRYRGRRGQGQGVRGRRGHGPRGLPRQETVPAGKKARRWNNGCRKKLLISALTFAGDRARADDGDGAGRQLPRLRPPGDQPGGAGGGLQVAAAEAEAGAGPGLGLLPQKLQKVGRGLARCELWAKAKCARV